MRQKSLLLSTCSKIKLRPKHNQFSTYRKLKCAQTPISSVLIAKVKVHPKSLQFFTYSKSQSAPKIPSVEYLEQIRNSKCTQNPFYLKVMCVKNPICSIGSAPKIPSIVVHNTSEGGFAPLQIGFYPLTPVYVGVADFFKGKMNFKLQHSSSFMGLFTTLMAIYQKVISQIHCKKL